MGIDDKNTGMDKRNAILTLKKLKLANRMKRALGVEVGIKDKNIKKIIKKLIICDIHLSNNDLHQIFKIKNRIVNISVLDILKEEERARKARNLKNLEAKQTEQID